MEGKMNRTKLFIATLIVGVLYFVSFEVAYADTPVPGQTIYNAQQWTLAGSPYIVQGGVFIASPAGSLTIDPGVVVRFTNAGSLTVNGALSAQGAAGQTVVFTSDQAAPAAGDWTAIQVRSSGTASFSNCEIAYAGRSNNNALTIQSSNVTVQECYIHHNFEDGIFLEGDGMHPHLSNLRLENNASAAIRQSRAGMSPQYGPLTMSANGYNGVVIDNYWANVNSLMDGSQMGVPYIIPNALGIDSGRALTITAGTRVEFLAGGYLASYGRLHAVGTQEHPIVFTSHNFTPAPGDWLNMVFYGSSNTRMERCEVAYAGGTGIAALNIQSSNATIQDSYIHHSLEEGVYLQGAGIRPILEELRIESNGLAAVMQSTPSMSPSYRNLHAAGNNPDAIVVAYGVVSGGVNWDGAAAGLPYQVTGNVELPAGTFLAISPGTTVEMRGNVGFSVYGSFYAIGTATSPITITGVTQSPGSWRNIAINASGEGYLNYCDVGFGGASGTENIYVQGWLSLENCRIHHSQNEGVYANNAQPYLAYNQIYSNTTYGVYNNTPAVVVDGRENYWGSSSGPRHATNPAGLGDRVSDGVLFTPWLESPEEGGVPPPELVISVGGPTTVSPGGTADYALFYLNQLTQTVTSTVIILSLPGSAELVDAGGGIYWPEYHKLIWKLGDLNPDDWGMRYARVKFYWGLPSGSQDEAFALLSGPGIDSSSYDVSEYLDYAKTGITSQAILSDAQLNAELLAFPELGMLFDQAERRGFGFILARRMQLEDNSQITDILFIKPGEGQMMELVRQDADSFATYIDPAVYAVFDGSGGITVTLETDESQMWGDWNTQPAQGLAAPAAPNKGLCFKNCLILSAIQGIFENYTVGKIPYLGDVQTCRDCLADKSDQDACLSCANFFWGELSGISIPGFDKVLAVRRCHLDCKNPNNYSKYICTKDQFTCLNTRIPGVKTLTTTVGKYFQRVCDRSTGLFTSGRVKDCGVLIKCDEKARDSQGRPCSKECEKVGIFRWRKDWRRVIRPFGPLATEIATAPSSCDAFPGEVVGCSVSPITIRAAHDPNEKYGPAGYVLPGQVLTYTVAFENEGDGTAYGVYITDWLDDQLDASTLTVHGGGRYLPASRTIIWDIGELAPQGQIGASGTVSFTIAVEHGLPSGSVVTNQAIVRFPSVPETTPTNVVVNLVQPLIARSQSLHTGAQTPVNIQLEGVDASQTLLSFQVTSDPLFGALSGAPPNLVYTPQANFTGEDHFLFVANNGVSLSEPAEIQIIVEPSTSDTTPPEVYWTSPWSGAQGVGYGVYPVYEDAQGGVYAPSIIVQFSEAISQTTLTTTSLQMVDRLQRPVPATLSYNGISRQARLTLRSPLSGNMQYTVTIGTDVRDISGNALHAPYQWSFTTVNPPPLYLPLINRD
jgi:uncharacterized repeat protein (TIGR01451 family)